MDADTPSTPNFDQSARSLTLDNDVSALELTIEVDSPERLGGISLIPKGSTVEIFGFGFNERTYKIRCQDRFYYVFIQDLLQVTETRGYFVAAGSR